MSCLTVTTGDISICLKGEEQCVTLALLFPPPSPTPSTCSQNSNHGRAGFLGGDTVHQSLDWRGKRGLEKAAYLLPAEITAILQSSRCHILCVLHNVSACPSPQVAQLFDKSSLSPYIRFGCLSVRYFLWNLKCYAKSNPKLECLLKEIVSKLLQREFFLIVAAQVRGGKERGEGCPVLPSNVGV